jgi:L-ascorbate metabolism protein UlaG (beta-lactamase superfamily)
MKIKKLGHCCLVIEENGKRIMTDPGSWTINEQIKEKNIDLIIITHEHQDHIHIESLKTVLKNNPKAVIITNEGVGKLLDESGIKYEILENKSPKNFLGIELEAHDCKHEEIYQDIFRVQNTGFFISKRLFYPGDAFYNPGKAVEILALPVAGPWANVKNAINYVLEIKPKVCFPVHDGMLISFGASHEIPAKVLKKFSITFKSFEENKEEEF